MYRMWLRPLAGLCRCGCVCRVYLSDRVEVDVAGEDGTTRKELHLLGLGILGSMQGFEALHALTKVCSWTLQQSHLAIYFGFVTSYLARF